MTDLPLSEVPGFAKKEQVTSIAKPAPITDLMMRGLDLLIAFPLLLLLSPVLIGIGLLIRLTSPGPAFYRQDRTGRDGRVFRVFKFRTMTAEASRGHFVQAVRSDPRVTRLGAVLRRTSVDELPQLLNVLTGDMSLVGPRPHPVDLDAAFAPLIPGYQDRFLVRPGITGLAQVRGHRGVTETVEAMADRVESDRDYVRRAGPLLNLRILLQTAIVVLFQKNAF
jgi:putative colanic acid biosysnthesis UDP-glucose lipid carrier transferase